MAIYIQKIKTVWTKKSRGNPNSSLRNKVPEKLNIEILEGDDSIYLQEIIFTEGSFNHPKKKKPQKIDEIQIREHRLDFLITDDILNIGFWTEKSNKKEIWYFEI